MPILQKLITRNHFAELVAEESLNPRGVERADWHAGIIASTIANVHRAKGRAFKAQDFMPNLGIGRRQTQEEIVSALEVLRSKTVGD